MFVLSTPAATFLSDFDTQQCKAEFFLRLQMPGKINEVNFYVEKMLFLLDVQRFNPLRSEGLHPCMALPVLISRTELFSHVLVTSSCLPCIVALLDWLSG